MGKERFIKAVVFWLAAAGVVLVVRWLFLPCMGPFLVGWLTAALVRPAARRLSRSTPLGNRSASFLTLLLFWAGAGLLIWWLGAAAFSQGAALLERLPSWYRRGFLPAAREMGQQAMHLLGRVGGPEAESALRGMTGRLGPFLQESISTLSARLLAAAGSFAGRLPAVLLACSFTVLSSFFILPDYERIGAFLLRQLPQRRDWRGNPRTFSLPPSARCWRPIFSSCSSPLER